MAKKSYTLIVVPDHHANVKRYRLQKRFLVQIAVGVAVLVALIAVGSFRFVQVSRKAAGNEMLRDENVTLRNQLLAIRARIDHIGSTLDRVERFDQKLRAVTLLSDPQRHLAMGPTQSPKDELSDGSGLEVASASVSPEALSSRLNGLEKRAKTQEQSLQTLQAYFREQKSLLASTPSIWPVRGWVTSDFGQRLDPYTAERVMHEGLDIAAAEGKHVRAPADGTVVYAGLVSGYGNVVVIDHGFGIQTRYGHLSQILVKAGQHVKRGQYIAEVGNTGRSTGPHLHYEVRVNGVPENPRKFILEN